MKIANKVDGFSIELQTDLKLYKDQNKRQAFFLKLFSCKSMTIWINWKEWISPTATTRSHGNNMEGVGRSRDILCHS